MLRRSAAPLLNVAFLIGVGTAGTALRAFARDAAVGANKPDPAEGVFGREVPAVKPGVFGRDIWLGVDFELDWMCLTFEGVEMADLVDVPVCWGLRGCELDEVKAGERTGDFLVVLGVGVFVGVDVGFRAGDDFTLVDGVLEAFTDSEAVGGADAGSLATGLAGGAAASAMGSDVG